MEVLWKSYGTTREQQATNALATGFHHACKAGTSQRPKPIGRCNRPNSCYAPNLSA
jgi:hypothetical protein